MIDKKKVIGHFLRFNTPLSAVKRTGLQSGDGRTLARGDQDSFDWHQKPKNFQAKKAYVTLASSFPILSERWLSSSINVNTPHPIWISHLPCLSTFCSPKQSMELSMLMLFSPVLCEF